MSNSSCDHCAGPTIVWQRYSGAHLCARHLRDSLERRVFKELSQQSDLPRGSRIAVAYSGGKDSTVALHLASDLQERRPDLELVAFTIDEGIETYRPPALALAKEVCGILDVEHVVRRTKDVAGLSIDEVHQLDSDLGECSFCGVFRRRILNDLSKELGASHLVTGHNLDDTAQSILMNLASANLERLAKLGPHDVAKEGLVPRLLPLRTIPESEVYLYAYVRGLRWHDDECPYSLQAHRQVYRDVLYRLEESRPGTRHALLRTFDALKPLLVPPPSSAPMKECIVCGEPTSGIRCKACQFRERFLAPSAPS